MRFQAVPDDQQRLFQMGLERFEKFDNLFLLDAALVQPEPKSGSYPVVTNAGGGLNGPRIGAILSLT